MEAAASPASSEGTPQAASVHAEDVQVAPAPKVRRLVQSPLIAPEQTPPTLPACNGAPPLPSRHDPGGCYGWQPPDEPPLEATAAALPPPPPPACPCFADH